VFPSKSRPCSDSCEAGIVREVLHLFTGQEIRNQVSKRLSDMSPVTWLGHNRIHLKLRLLSLSGVSTCLRLTAVTHTFWGFLNCDLWLLIPRCLLALVWLPVSEWVTLWGQGMLSRPGAPVPLLSCVLVSKTLYSLASMLNVVWQVKIDMSKFL
jgi:hypothetical protein